MDFKDFIIGEKYNISALAIEGSFAGKKYAVFKLPTGRTFLLRAEDFEAVSPENGIKNTETAPKYDQNRLFRKGDKVHPIERNGRIFSLYWKDKIGKLLTVTKSESFDYGELPEVDGQAIDPAYLELVTPVEELERYYIEHDTTGYAIIDRQNVGYVAHYKAVQHPHAKEAAEAERDRLNAEYRKEQSND